MQDKKKRIKINNYLREKIGLGIVLLQETHSTAKDSMKWKEEWGGQLYQNHGTSNSRGVSIGFTNDFEKNKKTRKAGLKFYLLSMTLSFS